MVEPAPPTDPVSGRTTPTQRDSAQGLYASPFSDARYPMDERFNPRRRNTHAPTPPASRRQQQQQMQQQHQQSMPNYGYPPPDSVLNVPSPPYAPSYYTLHPQYAYPHPAYSPDGTPFLPTVFQYPHPTSPDANGFSPFAVTPSPSPPSAAGTPQNPYGQPYQPLRVSPPMSNPQQFYGYSAYAPTPQYQFYQDTDGQWWYPSQQQQPQQQQQQPSQPQTYDAEYYSSQDRFSPVVRPDPSPVVHAPSPPVSLPQSQQSPPPLPPPPPVIPPPSSSRLQSQPQSPKPGTSNHSRPAIRKPYHPNPPSYRSEWVMWAGNVPSDAKHEELWRFFTKGPNEPPLPVPITKGAKSPADALPDGDADHEIVHGGVVSIFLISRSSCAFVNYESEAHLHAGIARFNGQSLRPHDPRVPKLVCRVRRREDDLKAGVGGQRGNGMHTKWLKDNKNRQRLERSASITSSHSSVDSISGRMSSLSVQNSSEDEHDGIDGLDGDRVTARARGGYHTGSSSSYASTNSSVLSRFPKRYFILKSLTQYDLDLSVQRGLWATQKHNEGILDQAFRTSQEVYLIFGVNKSGEFYGYARMASRVPQPQSTSEQVPWAQRSQPPSSASSTSSSRLPSVQEEEPSSVGEAYFDGRLVDESPAPLSSLAEAGRHSSCVADEIPVDHALGSRQPPNFPNLSGSQHRAMPQSAPPELGHPHRLITVSSLAPGRSLDLVQLASHPRQELVDAIRQRQESDQEEFQLNPSAPVTNMRSGTESDTRLLGASERDREDAADAFRPSMDDPSTSNTQLPDGVPPSPENPTKPESWGEPFKVEWLCTDRLPFTRTKHLRNPWNHDREVKVSRDGTEIEPHTGQMLLDEWERMRQEASSAPPSASPAPPAQPVPSTTSPRNPQTPQFWRGGGGGSGRRAGGGTAS